MGLSHPVASKVQEKLASQQCRVATCSMQGYRLSMEDAHSAILQLQPQLAFFGVFDGHGGAMASKFCAEHVYTHFTHTNKPILEQTIKDAVLKTDQEFLVPENEFRAHGSTCVFALVDFEEAKGDQPKYKITISNTGDSRCLWGTLRNDSNVQFLQCTDDHKPTNAREKERILKADGIVSNGRVDGDLSVSRAIGDWQFKTNSKLHLFEQKVSPEPDIFEVEAFNDDWILLACDGIFERLSSDQVARFINEKLSQSGDPVSVSRELCDYAIQSGSKDNMTVVLIYFKEGMSWLDSTPEVKAGEPFYIDGPVYPEDPSFMNAYRRFAVDNGFADRVSHVPVVESSPATTTPPILQLLAQLQANNVQIIGPGGSSVVGGVDDDDDDEEDFVIQEDH
jgi:serine/threonine protein phosphatase PrpC